MWIEQHYGKNLNYYLNKNGMWTNYYMRTKICSHCERHEEEHLGKSSMWRDFTIRHHTEKYNSFSEFKKYIKQGKLFDEYWKECTHKEFIQLIQRKKKDHPFEHKKMEEYERGGGKYIDGYYFCDYEFC